MMSFLASFSSSFLIAILAWPFVAALLTIPVLIVQYRKFNRIHWPRIILVYLFILYGLGLLSFTLYPMPDNPTEFCRDYHLGPQLVPFTFLQDITHDGLRAVLQVVMNVIFFVPLGVFARIFFRWKLLLTGGVALLVSLAIETAQLTGAFGLYPCSYRLFDVDDLAFNTIGAVVGYLAAIVIPRKELEYAAKEDITTNAGGVRRLVGFLIDNVLYQITAILVVIPIYLVNKQLALDLQPVVTILAIVVFHFIVPLTSRGKTFGGRLTRMSLDNIPRSAMRRLSYYLLRLIWVGAFLLAPGWIPFAIAIITIVLWLTKKRLPYVLA